MEEIKSDLNVKESRGLTLRGHSLKNKVIRKILRARLADQREVNLHNLLALPRGETYSKTKSVTGDWKSDWSKYHNFI